MGTAKTQILQERWGANAGRTVVRPPAPHFPAPERLEKGPKRETDGREGAISGRLARKATGVSPSGFARIGVFAENGYLSISPDTIGPSLACCDFLYRNKRRFSSQDLRLSPAFGRS